MNKIITKGQSRDVTCDFKEVPKLLVPNTKMDFYETTLFVRRRDVHDDFDETLQAGKLRKP